MKESKRKLQLLMLLSFFTWSTVPLLYAFIPVYFKNVGFNDLKIGILTSLGPLCCILVQPFIGVRVDRARSKNAILMLLYSGVAISITLTMFSTSFYYLLAIGLVLAVFQSAMVSVSETITLEHLENTKWDYGIVRACGTIGYALLAVLLGYLIKVHDKSIFVVTALTTLACILIMLGIPRVKGHQSDGQRVSFTKLFQSPQLMVYLFFNMTIQISLGFFSSFFPIYLKDMGGGSLLGITLFITAASELPFLFNAQKLVNKLGVPKLLVLSMVLMSVRLLLLSQITNPYWTLPVNVLHGGTFIVFTYSLATFINKEAPKELRATGQTFNSVLGMGIGRMLGSILGGGLSQTFGLRQTFLITFLFNFVAVGIFGFILWKMAKKPTAVASDEKAC
ncbi:MAG: MFS transporter [Clostridia bacterium]|nr:MFS transporter [Clostridia bacterium]